MAYFRLFAGHCNVDRFVFKPVLKLCLFDLCALFGDFLFNVGSDFVCKLADNGPFLCGKLAHLLQN